jgi:hypothetical protein
MILGGMYGQVMLGCKCVPEILKVIDESRRVGARQTPLSVAVSE